MVLRLLRWGVLELGQGWVRLGSGSGLGGGGATFLVWRRVVAALCTSWTSQVRCQPAGMQPRGTCRWDGLRDTRWRRAVAELLKSISKLPTVSAISSLPLRLGTLFATLE